MVRRLCRLANTHSEPKPQSRTVFRLPPPPPSSLFRNKVKCLTLERPEWAPTVRRREVRSERCQRVVSLPQHCSLSRSWWLCGSSFHNTAACPEPGVTDVAFDAFMWIRQLQWEQLQKKKESNITHLLWEPLAGVSSASSDCSTDSFHGWIN